MFQEKSSSPQRLKLSSQQYSHLTVKEIKQSSVDFQIDYYSPIERYFKPMNKTADKISQLMQSPKLKQQVIYYLVSQIRQNDPQYVKLKQKIKQQLTEKGFNISQMQSRRKTFAIDCLKEVMSYPFKQPHRDEQEVLVYNFIPFWRFCLDKELRRVLWQKSLVNEQTKQQFFTYDHELTPYNIQSQFRLTIQRISQKQGIRLKELQKDMAIKLLEYTVKRTQTLPNRSQVYMALCLVQLFSYFNMSRINEIGGMYCGLQTLSAYYYEPNVERRIQRLMRVIELVDVITFRLLDGYFFSNPNRAERAKLEMNQIYEHFRLSLTTRYLPLNCSQFMIDQLLIKKRSLIDMYILFGIVVLVLGDHIQKLLQDNSDQVQNKNQNSSALKNSNIGITSPQKITTNNNSSNDYSKQKDKNQLQKSLLKQKLESSPFKSNQKSALIQQTTTDVSIKLIFQQSKSIIKLQEVVQAFNIIFEKIPPTFSSQDELKQTNRLFSYMLEVQRQAQIEQKQRQKQKQAIRNKYQDDKLNDSQQQDDINSIEGQTQLQMLQRQLKQLKKTNPSLGTLANNFNGFLIIRTDKTNYQRLGRRQ